MSAYKSEFLRTLAERGFIHQVSEPEVLDAQAASSRVTAYIGFDCTAPSLHVGSLLPIMLLYWLQQTGHRPIALGGGGTALVGAGQRVAAHRHDRDAGPRHGPTGVRGAHSRRIGHDMLKMVNPRTRGAQ